MQDPAAKVTECVVKGLILIDSVFPVLINCRSMSEGSPSVAGSGLVRCPVNGQGKQKSLMGV